MKALFTVQPTFGHFHAMVPLAQALTEHGHWVAFATGRSFGPVIRQAGFAHFPCGLDFDGSKDILEALPEWGSIQAAAPPDTGLQQLHGFVRGLAPRMATDLIALVESWRPDVIVRDPLEFGGYIAAERGGLPHATILWATYISARALCPHALEELRSQFGLPANPERDTLDRYLAFDFMPPSWTFPGMPYPPVTHRFGATPFDLSGPDGLPDWIEHIPDRPIIYATLGTTFNRATDTFRAILDAFRELDANLLLTVGRWMDPAAFGPQPDHIRIAQYIPQSLLLPRCSAIIFHGGYNTLMSALWQGLPVVVMPQGGGDQQPTGRRCASLGMGVLLEDNPPDAEAIRDAVRGVLEQPGYRMKAQSLQRELRALPPLSEAVYRLERLARERVPQLV